MQLDLIGIKYDHLCYQYYLMKTLVVCLIIRKCIFAFRLYMYVSISLKSRCHMLMKESRDNLKIAWRHRQNDRKPSLRNICDWLIWYKFKKQNRSITMYPEYFHFNLLSLSYLSEHFCMCARSIFFKLQNVNYANKKVFMFTLFFANFAASEK